MHAVKEVDRKSRRSLMSRTGEHFPQKEQEEQEDKRGKCSPVRLIRMCHSIFMLLVCVKECLL